MNEPFWLRCVTYGIGIGGAGFVAGGWGAVMALGLAAVFEGVRWLAWR